MSEQFCFACYPGRLYKLWPGVASAQDMPCERHSPSAPRRAGHPAVYKALEHAADLHDAKNQGYRSADDPLANFKEAPPVTQGLLTPLQYAYTLMSKQDDALARLVWARALREDGMSIAESPAYHARGGDAMLRERLMDGIVYRALMLALMEDGGA